MRLIREGAPALLFFAPFLMLCCLLCCFPDSFCLAQSRNSLIQRARRGAEATSGSAKEGGATGATGVTVEASPQVEKLLGPGTGSGGKKLQTGAEFMVYRDGAMNRVLTNVPPWGNTWETIHVPSRGKTYNPDDLVESGSPAGDYIANFLKEKSLRGLYMSEEDEAGDQDDYQGPTVLGQRAAAQELGLYMLVPRGWKGIRGRAEGHVFTYRSRQDPKADTEVLEAYKLTIQPGEVLEDFNDRVVQNLLKRLYDGAVVDFTGPMEFRYGQARKTILKKVRGVFGEMLVYIGMVAFASTDAAVKQGNFSDIYIITFQFSESHVVEYHVLFDAMIESIYFSPP